MDLIEKLKKLYCKLFGHDFEEVEKKHWEWGDRKEICRRCGMHAWLYDSGVDEKDEVEKDNPWKGGELFSVEKRYEKEVFDKLMAKVEKLEEKYPDSIVEKVVQEVAEEVDN